MRLSRDCWWSVLNLLQVLYARRASFRLLSAYGGVGDSCIPFNVPPKASSATRGPRIRRITPADENQRDDENIAMLGVEFKRFVVTVLTSCGMYLLWRIYLRTRLGRVEASAVMRSSADPSPAPATPSGSSWTGLLVRGNPGAQRYAF